MFFNKLYFFIPTSNNFFYYFLVVSVLTLVIFCLPFLLAPNAFFVERLSAYECGFDPFVSSKEVFESHFIVVAILFIVFDLEIIFLLPWVISGGFTEVVCFWSVFFFLFALILGLMYEWYRGGLSWPIFFSFKRREFFQ